MTTYHRILVHHELHYVVAPSHMKSCMLWGGKCGCLDNALPHVCPLSSHDLSNTTEKMTPACSSSDIIPSIITINALNQMVSQPPLLMSASNLRLMKLGIPCESQMFLRES